MLDAITSSQIAMNQARLSLNAISHNIANLHTPGYKKSTLFHSVLDEISQGDLNTVRSHQQMSLSRHQGLLKQTQHPLDFALSSEGVFVLQTQNGLRYTRRGDFKLNADGFLVSHDGDRVMSNSGSIQLNDDSFHLQSDGTLIVDGRAAYQLLIVAQLTRLGHRTRILKPTVHQGFLENSNVKSFEEMLQMTALARQFETSQRVMRTADQMLSHAINQLGE